MFQQPSQDILQRDANANQKEPTVPMNENTEPWDPDSKSEVKLNNTCLRYLIIFFTVVGKLVKSIQLRTLLVNNGNNQ